MIMSFAIMRIAKLKSWSSVSASGAHTYRILPTPNADPSRRGLNRTLIGNAGEVCQDMKRRVGKVTAKPRSNAVLGLELLLTASPEAFQSGDPIDMRAWVKSNIDWMRQTFGAENVAHVVLHRDETTPHLVAYIVPEKDGRLNAREIVGTPEKLSELQTSYASAVDRYGLERGLKGSRAKHTTIQDWYKHLNEAAAEGLAQEDAVQPPEPPPNVPVWKGQEARKTAMEGWKGKEAGIRRELVRNASVAALAASTAQVQVEQLREANSELSHRLAEMQNQLTAAYEALDLSKADIAALRKADTTVVAHRLGHFGEILPKENAVDLVKRIGGFDYGQAVAWLNAEFGAVLTGALVKKSVQDSPPPRPFTASENVIKTAVLKQTDALGCDKFRLSIVPEKEDSKPYLPGKSKSGEEKFYTRAELVELIPWLRFENNQGKHIHITPMDDAATYILLDDARVSVQQLEERGFQPCLAQRTSWNSEQVVFKVPKGLDRTAVLALFNEMNRTMGDVEMTGLRHPFRLAGFRNMKTKHHRDGKQPFVTVTKAVNRFCERCTALVVDIMRRTEEGVRPGQPSR
jgi:hypothetical protein